MYQQENSAMKITSKETKALTTADRSRFLTQLEIPFLVFLLKKLSSAEHPLSAGKLAQYMSSLTGEEHSAKTILRKLKKLCLIQKEQEDALISNTLFLTFGGYVVETTNKASYPQVKKVQSRYYFKPLLDAGDISLICGTITSNRYLSQQEKDYLLSRQQTLTVFDANIAECAEKIEEQAFFPTELPEKPTAKREPQQNSSLLLHHVNQLYHAIEKGYQIQLIYGIYDLDDKHLRRIHFHARNASNPYTLNPYALLWNNGEYYLLATHNGHDNPVHFRVDRIVSVHLIPSPDKPATYLPRAELPAALKPFFHKRANSRLEFDPQKYTSMYPLMGIYDEENQIECSLECTASTLSILIDTFGSNLTITPSPLPHSPEETDFRGKPLQFLAVRIPKVQYDNVLQFCLQQHSSITALYPPQLVKDIARELEESLQKCQKVLSTQS